jgi:hypothetical protein
MTKIVGVGLWTTGLHPFHGLTILRMALEVLTWQQLVQELGSPHLAREAVREQGWWRVLHDAYAPAGLPDGPSTRLAAARLVLPDDVVLSHWSALWLLGLDVLPRDREGIDLIDLVVPRGRHLERRPGLRPHSALVSDEELVDVGQVLAVSAARACVDVARDFGVIEGVACGDAGLRSGATTPDAIVESVERAAGLRGVVAARQVVPLLDGRSESLMESRVRADFVITGGIRMQPQVDLYDEDGQHCGRGDLFLDGVVVEYDGRAERLQKSRFVGDRRRQGGLSDLGLEIRQLTSEDYYLRTPAYRLGVLLRALAKARARTDGTWRFGPDTLRPPSLRPLPTRAERARRSAA